MEKPHRFLLDKVSSYAEEGAAFLRRRRLRSQPFARIGLPGGSIEAPDPDTGRGESLIGVATALLGSGSRSD